MGYEPDPVEALERMLEYPFRDRSLLLRALTHKSYAHEARESGVGDNETFEFLGDSVIGFVVGDLLFRCFPELNEGALSKMKAYLVSSPVLAKKAHAMGLGDAIRLGVGEEKSGGRNKDSLLANLFEAIVAAIYLDGGIAPARTLIGRVFEDDLGSIDASDLRFHDHKTALQELAQGLGQPLPEYVVVGEHGPDHDKRFVVEVRLAGEVVSSGEGSSKKEAQQQAAREALRIYAERTERDEVSRRG